MFSGEEIIRCGGSNGPSGTLTASALTIAGASMECETPQMSWSKAGCEFPHPTVPGYALKRGFDARQHAFLNQVNAETVAA